MIPKTYKSLKEKATEFKKRVTFCEGESTISNLIERMTQTRKLTSLSLMIKELDSYSPRIGTYIDPATSGFSSDCFEEESKYPREPSLSYTEVKNLLIDTRILQILSDPLQPKESMILLIGINHSVDFFGFKDFLNGLRIYPAITMTRFLFYRGEYSILLQFEKSDQVLIYC